MVPLRESPATLTNWMQFGVDGKTLNQSLMALSFLLISWRPNLLTLVRRPRRFLSSSGSLWTGFVKKCTSLDEVKAIVGDTFVVSDMIEVVKEKVDYHTMEVSTKHRLVLSLKKARISAATRLTHHSELPRATDAISDGLDLMADLQDDEEIEALIADVEDAFWQLSNRPDERKFFVAWIGGFYYIFLRAAQGSRNAGLTWATIMGLLGRFANSLFIQPAFRRARSLEECRLQIYVDDPWAVARGTAARRQIIFAKLTALWLVVGLPIAFHKASRGQDVKWIGVQFTLQKGQIVCTIPADKLLELKSLTLAYTKKNIISKKDLRSFAGKMQSVASLLFALRPFVATLWAALYSPDGGALNCIWTSQISHSLWWFLAFFEMTGAGPISRVFSLCAHLNLGPRIKVTTDASPFGIGGHLVVDTVFIGFFFDWISDLDLQLLGITRGSSDGQQCLEGLAALVALRLWEKIWLNHRCLLSFTTDNITALVLVRRLKCSSPGLRLLAQELALDFSMSSYEPDSTIHTPGVQNDVADALSRAWDPAKPQWALPAVLHSATRCRPPERSRSWWKSLVV